MPARESHLTGLREAAPASSGWPRPLRLSLDRLAAADLGACRLLQWRTAAWCHRFFALVSRLGDGGFWIGLAALLLLVEGLAAWPAVAEGLLVTAIGMPLYRALKRRTGRRRPYATAGSGLRAIVPALDQHSFPSGHTLHAVAYAVVFVGHYPPLAWALVPFAALVAMSRVVLGLHYPSDVLAGALLGTLLGQLPEWFLR